MRSQQLGARLAHLFDDLAAIGRDPATGGYHRLAWSAADLACRAWFRDAAEQRGLRVETDGNGSQWAWWGAPGPGAIVTGSHLDSVPNGGAYDGALGVVSAFLALDLLRERGVEPRRPLAVVNFTDEEGARFNVACVGSRLMTGVLDPDRARGLRDAGGTTLAEAMAAAGHDPAALGADEPALRRIAAFVELHIEQGRALTDLGAPVGLATEVWPHGRWRFRFEGRADHAGTTRLDDRRDPMLPFASAVLAAREAAAAESALATFGKVVSEPNGVNAIPSAISAWLDCRAPDRATVEAIVARVTAEARRAAGGEAVDVAVDTESYTPATHFDTSLRARLQRTLGGVPELPTGAGHDAGILGERVPSAMLFVRNCTGVSHSPDERAEPADCVAGVEALAAVLHDLVTVDEE